MKAHRDAVKEGPESVKELKQELSSNAEEAFQLSGIQVFPQDVQDLVAQDLRDPLVMGGAVGNFDEKGRFHGVKNHSSGQCHQEWCKVNHSFEAENPLQIWEWPEPGCQYTVGVDVGEGLGGKKDFSVAWVNRVGGAHNPDVHVATYRTNTISAADFAAPVNFIGRMYNEALMSIEYNIYQTTGDLVRIFYQYPNLYRWKHLDSQNINSNKWHWLTQMNSKPQLWQNAVRRLRAGLWIVRDRVFHHEIKRFQKEDEESRSARAEDRFHDDVCMAAMISSYTSHDTDWDEHANAAPAVIEGASGMVPTYDWQMSCAKCKHAWGAKNPEESPRCPNCGSYWVSGKPTYDLKPVAKLDLKELEDESSEDPGELDLVAAAAEREHKTYG